MGELPVLRQLLSSFARQASGQAAPEAGAAVASASPRTWRKVRAALDFNRVSGMVGAAVINEGGLEALPPEIARHLRLASESALALNRRRLETFFGALGAAREADAEPVLLKSAGMACRFPALLAHNQMSDVDLYIPADRLGALEGALLRSGFSKVDTARDAVYFRHESGELLLDLHHRFRLFEHLDFGTLTRRAQMRLLPGETATVLGAEAELVHLVYHLNGHRGPHGYSLRWLFDILVLLVEEGPTMDADVLAATAPDGNGRFWTARILGFFEGELGVSLPPAPALPARAPGFSLSEVLTSQRHARFPLDELRGWKSLIACLLGLREKGSQRAYPRPLDALRHLVHERAEQDVRRAWQAGR